MGSDNLTTQTSLRQASPIPGSDWACAGVSEKGGSGSGNRREWINETVLLATHPPHWSQQTNIILQKLQLRQSLITTAPLLPETLIIVKLNRSKNKQAYFIKLRPNTNVWFRKVNCRLTDTKDICKQ